jgi:hypothetical protein
MGMQKVIINHVDGGTVEVLQHVESLDAKDLSKNQKKKLLKGYYSKEKHVAMLTSLMNGKHYNRKANNKNGILPSQMAYVRQATKPVWLQAHDIREQEKRI